jgi:NTE family protein
VGERHLVDGAVASNTPIRVALELGATRMIVLPSLMDLERCGGQAEIVTVPSLCPLAVSPYDFSQAGVLIERTADQTRRWLQRGGLEKRRIPGALRPHED